MRLFIGGLIEGILDFLTDLWLLRKQRNRNDRPENSWQKDATDVVILDWWLVLIATGAALLGFVVLFYIVGFSFGISFFIPTTLAALYLAYRWIRLTKD
ncbi:hypothetical protein [Pseudomonas sp. GD03944]|uniref:hypothetical protein n=1 Tax=Pseudomonas sp. GD03944 TaxID=2975409 RepID=UPI00244AC516|nr:hypothetical protein [Pseudomonas sp. GD03944]MDH1261340.1 hypothetical protein [Pseudomonas sp. GD03944]